jgi:hypothetical protein
MLDPVPGWSDAEGLFWKNAENPGPRWHGAIVIAAAEYRLIMTFKM